MLLNRLRELFAGDEPGAGPPSEALSTALLLLELARADFEVEAVELNRIRTLLAQRYGLDDAALDALLEEARSSAAQSVSLHDYVQSLNASLDGEGKRALMTMLWRVAYADGRVDKYEEHLLRRLADLLYVPMSDYIRIKLETSGKPAS